MDVYCMKLPLWCRSLWTIVCFLVLMCATCGSSSQSKLVFVSVTHRHGDRSPWYVFPRDNVSLSSWYEGLGQLSEIGMCQAYHLGEFLRQRYTGELNTGLIFTNYTRTQIHVRSTDVDRTIMTAQCLLAALFKPNADQALLLLGIPWQPVPIHTVPEEKDTLLRAYRTYCPRYSELMEATKATPKYKALEEDNKDFFNILKEKTGLSDLSLYTIDHVYDSVLVHQLYNHTFPWANVSVFNNLEGLYNTYLQLRFDTVAKQRLTCGNLVSAIVDEMTAKESGSLPQEKIHIYSAHDTTVAMLLSCLGVFDGINPGYTSAVIIELYRTENNQYYVEVWYKFGPVDKRSGSLFCNSKSSLKMEDTESCLRPLTVPGCSDFQCPLQEFKEAMAAVIPSDLSEECQIVSADSTQQCTSDWSDIVKVVLLLVLNALVLGFMGRWWWKRQKRKQYSEETVSFLNVRRAEVDAEEEEEEDKVEKETEEDVEL